MKLLLLCILPVVLAVPLNKRFLLNEGGVVDQNTELSLSQIRQVVGDLALAMEKDETEQACEAQCHEVMPSVVHSAEWQPVAHSTCPLICRSFQSLIHIFNINVMHNTTPASA